jgi:hypothetical protein
MQATTKLPSERLEAYFDAFTKHFLRNETTNTADVEVVSKEWGDQFEAEGAHLVGVSYDPRSAALDFFYEGGDHRVYSPAEVWTVEETDGFVRAIEIVNRDGSREVVRVRRLGVRPRE